MLNIKRVLVPTDLSPSARRAADVAAELAEPFEAEIQILHVTTGPEKGPLEDFFGFIVNHPRQQKKRERVVLERLEQDMRRHLGQPEPTIRHVERPGANVALTIIDFAVEADVDLIVMGTHGHRSLEHALGGTTGEVLRRAGRPVLTVRDYNHEPGTNGKRIVSSVLVPVDFSPASREAAAVARDLAALFEGQVTLLFVAEERSVPIFSDTGIPTFNTIRLEPEMVENAGEALRALYREVAGSDAEAQAVVRSGNPAREILAFAREHGTSLIVMSTHGQTGDEIFSLGSVTERVARRSLCPVLVLDPLGKSVLA